LFTPSLLIFEISNIGRRGSVYSLESSGLNKREIDSPLPFRGCEYFHFLLQRDIFHPLIRTIPGFVYGSVRDVLYRAMYGGFDHHPVVDVILFHRLWRHPPLVCELII